MKKFRIIHGVIIFVCFACQLQAQQLSQYSQYLNNYFLVNSAAADIRNNVTSIFSYRLGTGSFSGTPKTLYLSAYAPINKPTPSQYMQSAMRVTDKLDSTALLSSVLRNGNHIAGINLVTDQLGLFKKTAIHASYSYHLTLTKNIRLSASPKLGWVNLNLADDLTVYEPDDQKFQEFIGRYEQLNMLDIGFGLWLYGDDFFFGYSIEQMVKGKAYQSIELIKGYEFRPHHYVLVGTKIPIDQRWSITPNAFFRMVVDTPVSFDISAKIEYGSRLWAALSYRKKTAMVFILGAKINKELSFSYSFDQTINATRTNQISAHEIGIQYQFFNNLHK